LRHARGSGKLQSEISDSLLDAHGTIMPDRHQSIHLMAFAGRLWQARWW
jgi:hypothetical protein